MTVRVRFPPSPTGYLHIGGARTALFNWLYARKHAGVFVLRIEDTDRERSSGAAVQAIMDGMDWLGLDYDEGPFFQTERYPRYREIVTQLLDEGKAYRCYCSKEEVDAMRAEARARGEKPRYNGYWRDRDAPPPKGVEPVIRFKNSLAGEVVVADRVRGHVRFDNTELDDLVIARADGTPTYHLTVCVDDMDMAITHVIRGDDHLNNTPRQINILTALGAKIPEYAHVSMILGEDSKRLSKRHGAVSVTQYREDGYLPEALLNYLVRLGWAHGDQEVFTREELIATFDLDAVNKAAATFDGAKLQWLNQHYIKSASSEYLTERLARQIAVIGIDCADGPDVKAVAEVLRERAKTLVEMAEASRYFFEEPATYDEKAARKNLNASAGPLLAAIAAALGQLDDWVADTIHQVIEQVAEQFDVKLGKVAQPLRVAVTGGAVSPPIDATVELIGRPKTLARIDAALAYIKGKEVTR